MAKPSQAIEDYLKHIYLIDETGEKVTGQALAHRLKVAAPSVTAMLRRLGEMQLIEYEPYKGALLTDQGRKIALEVIRHHRLIESYLAEVLGMPWDEVHDEAEVLEHHISERMEALMAEKLGHPEFDPHGHPIPSVDLKIPQRTIRPLASLIAGERATVKSIRNEHREMLRYLHELGITPDRDITVQQRAPLDGPMTILNDVGQQHAIGMQIAECIDVSA